MKRNIISLALMILGAGITFQSCFNLDEEAFDRLPPDDYYIDESSVKGAVASIYSYAIKGTEYCFYLQELPADQVAWRSWNGGAWGWDEGAKFVLSAQAWNSESTIIRQAWNSVWSTIGLCNNVLYDLNRIDPAEIGMTQGAIDSYIAEVRTLRCWAYYNIFELWGGTLPLNVKSTAESTEIPGSADPDFDTSCKKIYDFIITELDESLDALKANEVNRMNKAANRMIKARLLLNSEIFIKEKHYTECATLCDEIIKGDYGSYSIARDYTQIYCAENQNCPEVVMAFAMEYNNNFEGQNMRTIFLPYNYNEFFGCDNLTFSGWNCFCLTPSYDNIDSDGDGMPECFLGAPYNDKLGAVYARFNDKDKRKKPFHCDEDGTFSGMFLIGAQKNYMTGARVEADADYNGEPLVYVDQVGTFKGAGRELKDVMNARWGETNSGLRLVKYPFYPTASGYNQFSADEVEFRLTEVYYMLAECRLRAGQVNEAKELVKYVKSRYFNNADDALELPTGFTEYDNDWMLHEWGIEYLCEGRRRRTDLRRFDKFTQGQWWFFDRDTEAGYELTKTRDRKYEWYPLPETALMVNDGLHQNPNYI